MSSVVATVLRQIDRTTVPEMPDRIIAATAQMLELPLITRDRSIQNLTTLRGYLEIRRASQSSRQPA